MPDPGWWEYWVRTLPNGIALKVPPGRGMLQELYFTTIEKLTGIKYEEAKRFLQEGRHINSGDCDFWARNLTAKVVRMPDIRNPPDRGAE